MYKRKYKRDPFNYLKGMVKTDIRRKHRFEVSKRQIKELQEIIENFKILTKLHYDEKQWLSKYKDVLFEGEKQYAEMMFRAEQFLDLAINMNKDRLVYMDGHGRLTYCLLSLIKSRKIDIKMTCIDVNRNMHNWHKYLLPKRVICKRMNIFNIQGYETSAIYLNFCGISDNVQKTINFLLEHDCTMVSFSTRCGCKKGEIDVNKCKKCIFTDYCYINGSLLMINEMRQNFNTFIFNKN